uniref:helix-turn-helix domain-containing protein n=1 Tax=Marinobacterium profundum TaxID=1714300 RepID=UPI000ABA819E
GEDQQPVKGSMSSGGLTLCQKWLLREYIDANLHTSIRIDDLAQEVGLGVWTFSRRFSESFDCSAHVFVTEQRVERARKLLCEGSIAIKEVAYLCGFSDQAHLNRVLRVKLGFTPGQIKNATR